MTDYHESNANPIARITGLALLAVIAVGIASSVFVTGGINVNMNADAAQTIDNMMQAGSRVYAKAWISVGMAALDLLIAVGLFLMLRASGRVLALWSFVLAVIGATLVAFGALDTMSIATLLNSERMAAVPPDQIRALLVGFTAGEYTSFHVGLVVNALAKAGFFALFVRSRLVAAPIAWFGFMASIYVAVAIVGRDFITALGNDVVTMSFILGNLVAHVALGLYLAIRGVRKTGG